MDASARWGFILLEVIIAVACCLGNAVVIWAVWTCEVFRKPTFYFIASLAVADFLVGFVAIPLAMLLDIEVKASFHGCLFMCCVLLMLPITSIVLLLAIAVDRFLLVRIPLRYSSTVTAKRAWIVIALCWIISAVWGFMPMFGLNNQNSLDSTAQNNTNSANFQCGFLIVIPITFLVNIIFFTCLLPPLVIMTGLYLYIFLTTRKRLRAHIGETTTTGTDYQKEHKLVTSLALVLVLFAVCWLPLFLMNTAQLYGNNITVPPTLIDIGVLLSHFNSAVNPIVYAFRIPKIKETCIKMWRRHYHGREEQF
ncbi:adenosine receptor A3-like [Astyanax mexicanus]|uniref:Adenosine A3 receptor n=1 Tax=Astyanax mexicanus TaxID=7994 RepID=A0A8B9JM28_ASTMX|nr:adenosine receptor A3-like [Astyanax mexicanus]KAG9276926.1 adenosine receptor A3-like [Astyanax mexicanus]